MVAVCSLVNIQASFLAGYCLLILYSAFSRAKIQSESRTPSAQEVWTGNTSETQITCLGGAKPLILLRKALYKFIKSIKVVKNVMGSAHTGTITQLSLAGTQGTQVWLCQPGNGSTVASLALLFQGEKGYTSPQCPECYLLVFCFRKHHEQQKLPPHQAV